MEKWDMVHELGAEHTQSYKHPMDTDRFTDIHCPGSQNTNTSDVYFSENPNHT